MAQDLLSFKGAAMDPLGGGLRAPADPQLQATKITFTSNSGEGHKKFYSLVSGGSQFYADLKRRGFNFSILQYFRICNPPP